MKTNTERRTPLSNGDVIIETPKQEFFICSQTRTGLTPAQYIDGQFAKELIQEDERHVN